MIMNEHEESGDETLHYSDSKQSEPMVNIK